MERNIYSYDPQAEERTRTAFPALMSKVYIWMTMALAMTGLTAFYVANNEALLYAIVTNSILFYGLIIAEFALVMVLSARIMKMSFPVAGLLFAAYSIVNGVTLSTIFLAYSMESIANAFFVTAGTFGAMSLFGLFTKRDLSTVGRFLYMMLIGLIIATIVNIFLASSVLGWATTFYRCNRVQRPHCLRYAENESAAHRVSAYRRKQFAEDCSSLQPFALS